MPSWKRVIISGSDAALNSLEVTQNVVAQSFTGSLQGTASFALDSALLDGTGSAVFATTGSNVFIGDQTISGSIDVTDTVQALLLSGSLNTDKISFTQQGTFTGTQGDLGYSFDDGRFTFFIENDVPIELGQTLYARVRNADSVVLTKGTIVDFTATATGQTPRVKRAIATSGADCSCFIGVVLQDIGINEFGAIMMNGIARGLNLTAFNTDDQLYLSATVSGSATTTIPTPPVKAIRIGKVLNASASPTQGVLYVRPENRTVYFDLDNFKQTYNTGSFTGSFQGDGSQLSNVTASSIEYSNILNLPTLVSGSSQITYSGLTGIPSGIVSGSSQVIYSGLTGIPSGIVSGSSQIADLGFATTSSLNNYQLLSQKGNANGYASLDGNGKVPLTQINDALLGNVNFQGLWNASTNTPTLVNPPSSDTKGHYYIVTTGGTFAGISFEVGDWIISNGTTWDKVDNTDAVSSVFGRTGNVTAQSGDYNTSQVTESGNLYYTDARARAALSFVAGSGAYNSTTGVITIPTNTNQLTNGAGFITSNQTITLSGDVTGSGTTSIVTTLANSGVVAGTYNNIATQVRPFTVDSKGRITGIGTAVTITPAFSSITNTPTTLSGYGITDAYTQTQINNFFSGATSITGYNKSNWDTAFGWGNFRDFGLGTASLNQGDLTATSINVGRIYRFLGSATGSAGVAGAAISLPFDGTPTTGILSLQPGRIRVGWKIGATATPSWNEAWTDNNLPNPVQGTGAAGRVAFWNGTGSIGSDGGFVWDNQNKTLGIGTTGINAKVNIRKDESDISGRTLQIENLSTGANSNTSLFLNASGNNFAIRTFSDGALAQNDETRFISTAGGSFFTFWTNNLLRWSILPNGILQSNGAQTIQTSTGNLTLATNGGNGNINLTPHGTGQAQVNGVPITRGTGVAGRVAFWNGTESITSDGGLIWDNGVRVSVGSTNTYTENLSGNTSLVIRGNSRTIGNNTGQVGLGRAIVFKDETNPRYSGSNIETVSAIKTEYDTGGIDTLSGSHALTFHTFRGWQTVGTLEERWRITSLGILQSNGAQTIRTSTGNLTLATGGGNGNILLSPNGSGRVVASSASTTALFESVSGNVSGSRTPLILKHKTTSSLSLGAGIGTRLVFNLETNTTDADIAMLLSGINSNTDRESGFLSFSTASNSSLLERMRITSTGNVGIGNTANLSGGGRLQVSGDINTNKRILSGQENLSVTTGALRVIAQISSTNHDAAFFDFVIKKGNDLRAGTVYAVHNGTTVEYVETSTNDLGNTNEVVLSVDISGGNIRLLAQTDTSTWQIKALVRGL